MSYKPDNVPHLSPYMVVVDAQASIDFYKKAFGFEVDYIAKDDDLNIQHVSMNKDGACIMFCPEGVFGITKKSPITQSIQMPINMYVYCDDADALYKQAIAAEAKTFLEAPSS
jgi:uncharacterized glyoxalase superfamily protein PhnB